MWGLQVKTVKNLGQCRKHRVTVIASLVNVFLTMICSQINERIWGQRGGREQDKGVFALRASVTFILIRDLKITQILSFSTSNTLHLVSTTKTEAISSPPENRKSWSMCKPFFTGLSYCMGAYSNASSTGTSSYHLLARDTRSDTLSVQPSICSPSTLWLPGRAKRKCWVVGPCHQH